MAMFDTGLSDPNALQMQPAHQQKPWQPAQPPLAIHMPTFQSQQNQLPPPQDRATAVTPSGYPGPREPGVFSRIMGAISNGLGQATQGISDGMTGSGGRAWGKEDRATAVTPSGYPLPKDAAQSSQPPKTSAPTLNRPGTAPKRNGNKGRLPKSAIHQMVAPPQLDMGPPKPEGWVAEEGLPTAAREIMPGGGIQRDLSYPGSGAQMRISESPGQSGPRSFWDTPLGQIETLYKMAAKRASGDFNDATADSMLSQNQREHIMDEAMKQGLTPFAGMYGHDQLLKGEQGKTAMEQDRTNRYYVPEAQAKTKLAATDERRLTEHDIPAMKDLAKYHAGEVENGRVNANANVITANAHKKNADTTERDTKVKNTKAYLGLGAYEQGKNSAINALKASAAGASMEPDQINQLGHIAGLQAQKLFSDNFDREMAEKGQKRPGALPPPASQVKAKSYDKGKERELLAKMRATGNSTGKEYENLNRQLIDLRNGR